MAPTEVAVFDLEKWTQAMSGHGDALRLIQQVRDLGFAVVAFMPEELCGADRQQVEHRLDDVGHGVIEELATEPDPFMVQRGA